MVAPFPPGARAGAVEHPALGEASSLYSQYVWLARLAEEMHTETERDLKRTMQIAFHARQFRQWHAVMERADPVADIVRGVFESKRVRWPSIEAMAADLIAIRDGATALADWIEANASEYKQGYSINKEIAPGVMSDDPVKIAKTAAFATRLADFRALFGPKG